MKRFLPVLAAVALFATGCDSASSLYEGLSSSERDDLAEDLELPGSCEISNLSENVSGQITDDDCDTSATLTAGAMASLQGEIAYADIYAFRIGESDEDVDVDMDFDLEEEGAVFLVDENGNLVDGDEVAVGGGSASLSASGSEGDVYAVVVVAYDGTDYDIETTFDADEN